MTERLNRILSRLAPLIAADTQNPPRTIASDGPLAAAVREGLPGFDLDVTDLGNGSVIFDAVRGRPSVLFNVHLDTVPAAQGWSRNPHELLRAEDRAIGLGACDIKGAAAVLMALAAETDAPMRLVLTTDEEAGKSWCVRRFLETPPDVDFAVVAEPTEARAVTRHRGLVSASARFSGRSAHASEAVTQSAVHDAARWIGACLETEIGPQNRLNFGRIEGGVKPNMVAASAEVLYGFRAQPGTDHEAVLAELRALAPDAEHTTRFTGPALPSDAGGPATKAQALAADHVRRYGLAPGEPVHFFTEAALFAAAGVPVAVLGPGSIAQAHTADEWVSYDSLLATYEAYERIVTG
ncbi:acetylornithine deacetylase [Parvularcula dongshanensis]|uniref:Acetylornithine deacetylase n=1 Tax=Parvularcula dongshanensis TaxID=1173995 RepID=A0A840I102_9PROT|nr:acetylornithine deacetylase [Parvularcula dongshanensis]MBB4658417.1 acetylornithine deacetylase [Parvularcula dongshanensis]